MAIDLFLFLDNQIDFQHDLSTPFECVATGGGSGICWAYTKLKFIRSTNFVYVPKSVARCRWQGCRRQLCIQLRRGGVGLVTTGLCQPVVVLAGPLLKALSFSISLAQCGRVTFNASNTTRNGPGPFRPKVSAVEKGKSNAVACRLPLNVYYYYCILFGGLDGPAWPRW